MSDTIDRQAAIEAVKCGALSAAMVYGRTDEGSTALRETVKAIKALPSAQPYTDKEVQKIQDLEQSQFDKMYELGYQAGRSAQPDYIMTEWCTDCKEYDQERHCCPRFNKVIRTALQDAQPEIIYCKDCKHRPTLDVDEELHFPTYKCPCQCEDYYYSWMPKDDWFCGNAERREDD